MQLTYVVSELTSGLRRNVSMTIAVIVTLFVSLTLVGLGLLLNAQADKAEEFWGDRLQITVFLCTDNTPGANCIDGKVTAAQKAAVAETIDANPQVEKFHYESSRTAYNKWRDVYSTDDETQQRVVEAIRPSDLAESYWITLKDPQEYADIKREVAELDGVGTVRDLRDVLEPIYFWINAFQWGAIVIAGFLLVAAILQVGNTIRIAAFARRKEIGIMRLVGATNWRIRVPFLIEGFIEALLGAVAAVFALFLVKVVFVDRLRGEIEFIPLIRNADVLAVAPWILIAAAVVAVIAGTIGMRRFLDV